MISYEWPSEFEYIGHCIYCGARLYSDGETLKSDTTDPDCLCEMEGEEDEI